MKTFIKKISQQTGFTLLEVLLVVAAISILAAIVIVAINPSKQLGDTRNSQRKNDIGTILNAIYQYQIDNSVLPGSGSTGIQVMGCVSAATTANICKTGATCTAGTGTDLSSLTASGKYLISIPTDPNNVAANTTGYFATKDANGRVTVCAPNAEPVGTASVSASL
jgi:prepilin-type N-terminal cleavage/methylation domain-containing protein